MTIKLNADDGSYHDPVDSNTHTMNFEVDTPWSDYTGGYLSVENVLELTNSTFLETEPNGIQRDVQPLIRAKVGDSFQLQGKVSYLTDIRDSFRFEVEGTASLNVSWIEGDLQYRPELGVYDVHAAKFIYFDWKASDEISNVILNAHGGLREYELVLFHPSENGGEYKLEVEVNDLELGRIQKIRELEPNNTAFDAQYLGNLSRSLSYDLNGKGGDSKGSDFYEFDIFGIYPMQFSLYPYITSDEVELSVSLWDSKTGKQIRHFSRKDELHGFMHLSEGRYLIEVSSSQQAPYLLRLQQGDDSNSNTQGLAGSTTATLHQPNRRVPVGINYFEGLYKGNYTEIVSGELTFITPDNSNSNVARSVMRVGSVSDHRGAPKFQTIKLSLPKTMAARSSTGQMTANYSSYNDMADRYANLFHTIEALESYRTNYGNEQVQHTHYYYSTAVQPDDTKYATGNMWNIDAINLPEAWEITKGSKDVIVAVIDGGPAYHKDIMSSPNDPEGKYIQGYDFVSMDNDPFISSGNIHGGHVAGTIGAKANNGEGVVGKNWDVSIMPLRVCPGRSCSGNAILNAILYAAGLPNSSGTVPSKPADVMNMSLGGPGYDSPTHPYNTAMQSAVDAGTLPVCAAGNDGKDTDVTFYAPCGFDACMCVSAISPNLSPAGFTNYGSHIDISAPGVQIWSTVLNDKYEAWQGTSMASPHVAGVAGLIKSLNSNLTPQELRDFLEQTSTDLGNPGRDDHFGVGFLNAFKAAEAVGEDAGVFGPKLGTVPSSIIYGKGAAYQELTIVNKGSDDINSLTWSVEYTTATTYEWLVFRPEAGFGTTASKLGVYADKYHLNEGKPHSNHYDQWSSLTIR